MDKLFFQHSTPMRVRNYEVDWQGVVHNPNYLRYCEAGRIEYLRHIGARVDMRTLNGDAKIVLVRNETNYVLPAVYDELLTVYTRISAIRKMSFIFEGSRSSIEWPNDV
ncbi:MAG: acyl-CoA thioesterase [Ignavibacteriales bacterium]|nr:acyl-CoA thioesterase [Ignavibacteriales bacterium]